jgi:type II secretory pathway component PulF
MAVAYPLLLLFLCSMLIIFLTVCIVPDFERVMDDFGTKLPLQTVILFWFSGQKVLALFGFGIAAISMIIVLTRVSLPPQHWRWLQTRLPLFGPMILWRGMANWARLASLLIRQGLPTPEALRLAATGVNDALIAVEGLRLARATSNGRSIADSLNVIGRLPSSIVP